MRRAFSTHHLPWKIAGERRGEEVVPWRNATPAPLSGFRDRKTFPESKVGFVHSSAPILGSNYSPWEENR